MMQYAEIKILKREIDICSIQVIGKNVDFFEFTLIFRM